MREVSQTTFERKCQNGQWECVSEVNSFGRDPAPRGPLMDLLAVMRNYAAEHFYRDSWDALLRWTDAEIAAAIAGAKTRRGAIAKAWKVIRDIDARRHHDTLLVQRYGIKPVRPVSLFEYLASQGGVAPHAELAAILDGNPWVGGFGPLVRRNGMPLDEARRVAVAGGYLHDTAYEAGVATSTVRELLDALSDEARGRKVYPWGESGEEPTDFADDDPAHYAEESCDDIPF